MNARFAVGAWLSAPVRTESFSDVPITVLLDAIIKEKSDDLQKLPHTHIADFIKFVKWFGILLSIKMKISNE